MEPSVPLDPKVPIRHWTDLSDYDKQTYNDLRVHFRQQQKQHLKERKTTPFANEILCILDWIDHQPQGHDDRCIVAGIAFAGPFICVNTQQLKNLVCRCKSSINSGFQQIGYDALRSREKVREAILAIIPALRTEPSCMRQWTVRCVSDDAFICFVSKWCPEGLPQVSREDYCDEKSPKKPVARQLLQPQSFWFQPAPLMVRQVEDFVDEDDGPSEDEHVEAKSMNESAPDLATLFYDDLQASLSADFLAGFDNCFGLDMHDELQWAETPSWLSDKGGAAEMFPRSKSGLVYKGSWM